MVNSEEFKRELKIQIFLDKIVREDDRSLPIAKYISYKIQYRYYLDMANWNFRSAKESYEEDLKYDPPQK